MPDQTAANVLAAIKREAAGTPGTAAAAGAGALQLRLVDSPGLGLARTPITSNERRGDLVRNLGRLGSKGVGGSYNAEVTIGGYTDMLLEAIMRGTWSNALAVALAATDGTTTASTIVRATGSWITDGYRVGDIVTITGDATAANNNIRLRVVGITDTTITVAGTPLTANATARAFTVTRLKKVINPASPVRYSHTIEQYLKDLDQSELYLGCRLTQVALQFRPNAIATVAYTFVGMDRSILTQAQSPYYTAPSVTVGVPLIVDDGAVRFNGVDVTKFTSMDLNLAIGNSTQPVIGSFVTPDVYDGILAVTGTIAGIRQDMTRLSLFEAEDEFEVSLLMTEPGTAPLPALGLYMPRVKLTSVEAPFLGGDGPMIETMNFEAGPAAAASGQDATAIAFFSSAA